MTPSFLSLLALAAAGGVSALSIADTTASPASSDSSAISIRDAGNSAAECKNTATSRECWGEYDINTNYYDTIPHTGRTVTYWLVLEEIDCAPDGYKRKCLTANGTMPGPAITANWGDDVVVHVTNQMESNGTALHWHGVRQLNNNQYDGVPGVSQCPIPPGSTMTYKFHASQYGTGIYHSHFSLQYSMGLHGPIIINGPATANYDEDLGAVFLTDWDHQTVFDIWATTANFAVVSMSTGLINGKNTGGCAIANVTEDDPNCVGDGEKFELVFQKGKKYRLRIINLGTEAYFQFSIDGHKMTVIQTDFVPIVPYETDSIRVNMGQRYDVIVEANAEPDDYWMRSRFITACIENGNPDNITGIVRYDTESTKMPTSESTVTPTDECVDEPPASLVPWLPQNLTNMDGGIDPLNVTGMFYQGTYLRWAMNGTFMWTDWSNPALENVRSGDLEAIPESDNVFKVEASNHTSETAWAVIVIEDHTPLKDISHPIHLHGHDVLILASSSELWDGTTDGWQIANPPRRDVATLPGNGHLVIAWALDNPGLWAVHCHTAWHSSQGFAASVLESAELIPGSGALDDWNEIYVPVCEAWDEWWPTAPFPQDDSGI